MKQPKLYGIFLSPNGSILLAEMESESRDVEISKMLQTTRFEFFPSQRGFDGSMVICVADAYALKTPENKNGIASYICGDGIYGNVVILRANDIGFKCLMNHATARKIMEEIQNEYMFS